MSQNIHTDVTSKVQIIILLLHGRRELRKYKTDNCMRVKTSVINWRETKSLPKTAPIPLKLVIYSDDGGSWPRRRRHDEREEGFHLLLRKL